MRAEILTDELNNGTTSLRVSSGPDLPIGIVDHWPRAHGYLGAPGARCSSVVRAFAHGAMGRRIDPSWGRPIGLFLVPTSAPRLV